MWIVIVLAALLLICFGGVLLFGAPYLPTLTPQVHVALELANLKPGQTLLELGCGDGKILIAAAQTGVRAVGYELNPLLALLAWLRTRRFGSQVTVVCGNFWTHNWPEADAIFTFLLTKYMPRLDRVIDASPHKPIKLISFAFRIPNRTPVTEKAGVFLYEYVNP